MNIVLKRTFVAVLILLCSSPDTTSGQGRVAIDVKTKYGEKTDIAVTKAGSITLLRRSDWADVQEVGETYSLWLKNYTKASENGSVRVTLDVELRTPSMFRSGKLLDTRRIEVTYDFREERSDPVFDESLGREIRNASREARAEAWAVGKEVVKAARYMVERHQR